MADDDDVPSSAAPQPPDPGVTSASGPAEPPAAQGAGPAEPPAAQGAQPPVASQPPAGSRTRRERRHAEKQAGRRKKAPWWELPLLVVIAVVAAILIKTFLVQPFYIPSPSMERTLLGHTGHNDRILVSKISYDFGDPSPGDIVVFRAPPSWPLESNSSPPSNPVLKVVRGFGQLVGVVPPDTNPLIKRVMAVGGQTIRSDAQGHVQVANSPAGPFRTLSEPYTYYSAAPGVGENQQFGPVTVPKGDMWVMGDHRDDSGDSREQCNGQPCTDANDADALVPIKNVIGKAVVIAWPPSRWRTLGTPKDFTSAAGALGPALPELGAPLAVGMVAVPLRRRRRR